MKYHTEGEGANPMLFSYTAQKHVMLHVFCLKGKRSHMVNTSTNTIINMAEMTVHSSNGSQMSKIRHFKLGAELFLQTEFCNNWSS